MVRSKRTKDLAKLCLVFLCGASSGTVDRIDISTVVQLVESDFVERGNHCIRHSLCTGHASACTKSKEHILSLFRTIL